MGHALGNADQHAVVLRSAGVFVGADRGKAIVRPRTDAQGGVYLWLILEIKESRMCRIGGDDRGIGVPFTEETGPELSDVLDLAYQRPGKLVLHTKIHHVNFRVMQVGGNGANPSKETASWRRSGRQQGRTWGIGECRRNGGICGRDG